MAKEVKSLISDSGYKKSLKLAAISGIIVFVLAIIGAIISTLLKNNPQVASIWSVFQGFFINLFFILFTYGFYVLGKKYNSKFLRIISLITIILTVVAYLGSLYLGTTIAPEVTNTVNAQLQSMGLTAGVEMTAEQAAAFWAGIFQNSNVLMLLSSFGVYLLVISIISILFGAALIKIRKNIKYAMTAGILEIAGIVTAVIIIGVFALLASYVFQIIILFKEAKK